uniref:RNA polymerase beta'' subunit n=1 Tax=Glaucosphaera vacuolata TaxID=38265 RepID=UPI001FCD8DD6|nr:RNA polymerase beta'' subunit [Glaucosphaera vacuolata]UNJ18688.1 RNA polymerase beta'' subunit [Glaucosphaera vacuolata]
MKYNESFVMPCFRNEVIDKEQLKNIIAWAFNNYGIAKATNMADKLKDLGFKYATKAGISLSLEDLKIPPVKKDLLNLTIEIIELTEKKYNRGEITIVERFQKVIDTWNNASESLKNEAVQYLQNTDPLNPVYMMSFCGARGNISQVRQLVGMRGLMSDPQGQIIDLPIASNFREGLTVTEYFISSYGARKGLVDTALRTANSGYLTRRLVDVAQDVIIRESDCSTPKGILLKKIIDHQKTTTPLEQSLVGRVLAENIYCNKTGELIASARQDISPSLAHTIIKQNIEKVLVRSPLTCESMNSVCQYCYGWSLAHGRLVDLGEAVGIIAAQSIGEPGTQLTMRTFHTGGVFTGELAEQIYSPAAGWLYYPENYRLTPIRTRHGDAAFKVEENMQLSLKTSNGKTLYIPLYEGAILFYQNKQQVFEKDIIAEIPIQSRLEKAETQKYISSDISGQVYFSDLIVEETSKKHHTTRITQKGGIIWILSGQIYNIPDMAEIMVTKGQHIAQHDILARLQLKNRYGGQVKFSNNGLNYTQEIQVITDSITFANSKIYLDKSKSAHILETSTNDKFMLRISSSNKLMDGQTIADLLSSTYNTKTGGIIKYLGLPVSKEKTGLDKDGYEILGPGYILWIPEETHEVNKDNSLLLVKNGDIVEPGTEILKNIFCKNSGVIHIIHKDDIVKEIIIKPGKIYPISNYKFLKGKNRGFLKPGEKIYENLISDKLVYWELINRNEQSFIIIRPIIVYSILDRLNFLDQEIINKSPENRLKLKIVRKINFKDGERVKSINGVELIQTQLIVEGKVYWNAIFLIPNQINQKDDTFQLQFITFELLSLKSDNLSSTDLGFNNIKTKILVENNSYVEPNTVITQTEISSKASGEVKEISSYCEIFVECILILTDQDKQYFSFNKLYRKFEIGDWIYTGDKIDESNEFSCSGQILDITKKHVVIRIARPYLVSNNTNLYVNHNDLLQKGETLAILIFEQAKTEDIVQGLPRISEILEARKKKEDNVLNPHEIIELSFLNYCQQGLDLYDAAQLSFRHIQSFLINEIQLVYKSQNVDISEKHLEIIVRRMTEKVKIKNGGATGYLPGEIVELKKIYDANIAILKMNKEPAIYHPIVLGITKASLNTDSFISAASFQETTKVLTEAAISGRLDWLRGLKENVIIGRLIPAGTGFNMYNQQN